MPSYGLTPAGFVVKPSAQILADMQASIWSNIDPELDLSEQTPDGQLLGVYASDMGGIWELLQVVYGQYRRADAEGQALDNLGDLTGSPREGETYTQVYCDLVFVSAVGVTYPLTLRAGDLVANVAGLPAQAFANAAALTVSAPGTVAGVLFQAQDIGPTAAVNAGTLNVITNPVSGWSSITNPEAQSQLGTSSETDAAYAPRQAEEVAAEGSCNPSATVAAIEKLGAAQTPPVTLTATLIENTTDAAMTTGGLTLEPGQYAVFVYDGGTGWLTVSGNQQLVGATIYANRPTGNLAVGSITITIQDPVLGPQSVSFSQPTGVPLFIDATVSIWPGQVWGNILNAMQTALVAAAVASTPASGIPPVGQLTPGAAVIGSQLEAVLMSVPGVQDVQALTFDVTSPPANTAPIPMTLNEVATILAANLGNVNITQGMGP